MLYELREWSICLACWLTVYLDYKILMILVKEYLYDKDVYEAVLLKKMSTHRKVRKVTEKILKSSLGIEQETENMGEIHGEITKNLQSPQN